jgi:hypothetical protein
VWRYAGARDRWYIFLDRTSFGSYELITSNDQREPPRAGWEGLIGPDGLTDVSSFLNIDFVRRARSRAQ